MSSFSMLVIASNISKSPIEYARDILRMSGDTNKRDPSMGKLGLCHLFTAKGLHVASAKHDLNKLYLLVLTAANDTVVHSLLVSEKQVIADRDSKHFDRIYVDAAGRYKAVYDYGLKNKTELFIHSFKVSSL